jgi:hypothetical protein
MAASWIRRDGRRELRIQGFDRSGLSDYEYVVSLYEWPGELCLFCYRSDQLEARPGVTGEVFYVQMAEELTVRAMDNGGLLWSLGVSLEFIPDPTDSFVLKRDRQGHVMVMDVDKGTVRFEADAEKAGFSHDGRWMYATKGGRIEAYDVATGKQVWCQDALSLAYVPVKFSADGRFMVVLEDKDREHAIELSTGKPVERSAVVSADKLIEPIYLGMVQWPDSQGERVLRQEPKGARPRAGAHAPRARTGQSVGRDACPVCGRTAQPVERNVLHGNPLTPASDTEVELRYLCDHCGNRWAAVV